MTRSGSVWLSEITGELCLILFCMLSVSQLPPTIPALFKLHLFSVSHRKSITINPVRFASCFFTFEYTSIHLPVEREIDVSAESTVTVSVPFQRGEAQSFPDQFLWMTETHASACETLNRYPLLSRRSVSSESFTVFSPPNSLSRGRSSACMLPSTCVIVRLPAFTLVVSNLLM